MSPITITFSTSTVPGFEWIDSFKDLEDKAIEEILVYCRIATAAFEDELSHRRIPKADLAFENYCDMIRNQADIIRTTGLNATHHKSLNYELPPFLSHESKHHTLEAAKQFLWFVSRVLDRSYSLLIFCALRKTIARLSQVQRAKLIKHMNQDRDLLFCQELTSTNPCV